MVSMPSKLSPELERRLAEGADEPLVVVVELTLSSEEHDSVEAAKQAFRQRAEPIVAAIRERGGEVLGEVWLNETLMARVPPHAIPGLTAFDEVTLVDLPRQLEPDSA